MNESSTLIGNVAAAGFAGALASAALAGQVSPDLRGALQAVPPGQAVPVIVTLADRVDQAAFEVRDRRFRDGRLSRALKDKAAATQGPLKAFLAARGSGKVDELWVINGVAATVPATVVEELARFPGVESVRLDSLAQAPNGATGSIAPAEWNLDAVHAPALWSLGFTGSGMVVANMDTGVDALHPDLATRWRGGTNSWYDPHGEHAAPYDASGHGTQTMGLMVGGDAGGTSIGLAPGASWIATKLYNDAGYANFSHIHLAFQWLLDPDGDPATPDAPDVVNASWGLLGTAGQCITEFESDIGILRAAGIAVAFAAGNDGPLAASSLSPANNASSFSVGAVDALQDIASFSARGPSACTGGTFPNLVAPGVNVNTADLSFGGLPLYAAVAGTSYAAPHAAATMALLMQASPSATVQEVESALMQGAFPLGADGADNAYGSGLLDATTAFLLLGGASSPLSITSSPVTTATQDAAYAYTITASDAAGGALTFSLDIAPAGMAVDSASGLVTWTPTNAQVGMQPVTVRVTTASGQSATQSFGILVTNVNDVPVASADAYTVVGGATLSVGTPGVLANDFDPDGDALTAVLVAAPGNGTLALGPGGAFTYRPNAGYTGTDAFTYLATDGALSASATVTIAVTANSPPVAVNDKAQAPRRGSGTYVPVVIDVLANDSDPDGNLDASTVTITAAPSKGGAVTANRDGTVSYVPKAGFRGKETFKYKLRDSLGAQSAAATVTVTVP